MDEDILARYNSAEGADDYLHKFERHWTERVNNWHEQRLIRRFLRSVSGVDPNGLALDLPCGYGRLYSIVRELGIPVVEGDWSFPLLTTARGIHARRYALEPAQNYVRANALALPFSGGAFEFVLSVRLSHHIRDYEQRLQHLREVLRVSRKWVNVYLLRCWLGQESAARISQTISWQTSEMDPDARGGPDDRPCPRFRSHQMGVDFSLLFRPPLRAAAPKLIATGLGDLGSGHAACATHPVNCSN